jgi:hypothetical protein
MLPTGLPAFLHKSYTGYAREGLGFAATFGREIVRQLDNTGQSPALHVPETPQPTPARRWTAGKAWGRLVLVLLGMKAPHEGTINDDQARLSQWYKRPPGSADADAVLLRDLAHAPAVLTTP